MAEAWVTILVALLGSGVVTAILTAFVNRRQTRQAVEKARIDGAQVLTTAAVALLAPLQAQVQAATTQIEALTADLATSRQEVGLLTSYVEQLIGVIRAGGLPVPPPPEVTVTVK